MFRFVFIMSKTGIAKFEKTPLSKLRVLRRFIRILSYVYLPDKWYVMLKIINNAEDNLQYFTFCYKSSHFLTIYVVVLHLLTTMHSSSDEYQLVKIYYTKLITDKSYALIWVVIFQREKNVRPRIWTWNLMAEADNSPLAKPSLSKLFHTLDE